MDQATGITSSCPARMEESGSPLRSRIRSTVIRGSVLGAMLRAICHNVPPCATVTREVVEPWACTVVAPTDEPHGPTSPTPIATTRHDVLTTSRPRRVSRRPRRGTCGRADTGIGGRRRMGCGGTHAAGRRGRLRHPDQHSGGVRPGLACVVKVHRVVRIVTFGLPAIERAFEKFMSAFVHPGSDNVTTRSNMCLNNVLRVTTVRTIERRSSTQIIGTDAGRRA